MGDYTIRSVDISPDLLPLLREFSCGVPEMDGILHSQGLLAELYVDDPVAYCVYNAGQELVGLCIIGKINLPLEYEGHCEYLDMIDVACLAVRKDYRYLGIGTAILDLVCDKAEALVPGWSMCMWMPWTWRMVRIARSRFIRNTVFTMPRGRGKMWRACSMHYTRFKGDFPKQTKRNVCGVVRA